jgi:hypothetical protein
MHLIEVDTDQFINAAHVVGFHYTAATTRKQERGKDNWGDPKLVDVPVDSTIRVTMSAGEDVIRSGARADSLHAAIRALSVS